MKWSYWIELYIRTHCVARGLRPLTIAAYEKTLQQFRDWVRIKQHDNEPDQITARDVLSYVQYLREVRDNGDSAINRSVVVLRRFYAAMVAMGQLDHNDNPLATFPSIKAVPRKLPVALSTEQMTRLLSEPKPDTVLGLRDRALLALLYGTGIRASECAWLRNGNVDLEQLTITVQGKGGGERTIPLNSELAAVLRTYIEARGSALNNAPFFRSRFGKPLSRGGVYERVRTWGQRSRIGIPLSPHRTGTAPVPESAADLRKRIKSNPLP